MASVCLCLYVRPSVSLSVDYGVGNRYCQARNWQSCAPKPTDELITNHPDRLSQLGITAYGRLVFYGNGDSVLCRRKVNCNVQVNEAYALRAMLAMLSATKTSDQSNLAKVASNSWGKSEPRLIQCFLDHKSLHPKQNLDPCSGNCRSQARYMHTSTYSE